MTHHQFHLNYSDSIEDDDRYRYNYRRKGWPKRELGKSKRFISAIGVEAYLYMKITDFALDSRRFFRSLCFVVFMHSYCIDT